MVALIKNLKNLGSVSESLNRSVSKFEYMTVKN